MGIFGGPPRCWLRIIPIFALIPWADLQAQEPEVIGAAIAAACQGVPSPEIHSVLAGTVADSVSGVALSNALVSVVWTEEGQERFSETTTDIRGFFAFCGIPGDVEVEIRATLRVEGRPETVRTEAGMLHLVPLLLSLSDPTQPGLLMGRVIDADTRAPVIGASVFLMDEEARASALTNEHGYFSLGSHPWGIYSIRINHVAYGSRTAAVRVQGDMTEALEIEVSLTPIQLEELVVRATSRLKSWDMDGLVRRMDAGWGWFVTRDRIEKMPAGRLQDFVRDVPGVRFLHSGPGTTMIVRGKICAPLLFVDGMPWVFELEFALKEFLADELEAVEVFRGYLEIPGEFRTTSDPCAVIAIWTRKVKGPR